MKNGFTITQRNAVVEQHLWCIDTIMAQYAAFMQTEPVDPDDVYQSLAVRLIRAVNSYDPCKGYLKEYILSQLKREMVRIRSTQTVYGLTQAPANMQPQLPDTQGQALKRVHGSCVHAKHGKRRYSGLSR